MGQGTHTLGMRKGEMGNGEMGREMRDGPKKQNSGNNPRRKVNLLNMISECKLTQ